MKSKYDAIFADKAGTKQYYEWIKTYLSASQTVLECACGTGDLFHLISASQQGKAFDLDAEKIADAKKKFPEIAEVFFVADFLNIPLSEHFDLLYCVNDSTNYILNEEDLRQFVLETSKLSNLILLDSHHPYRLVEFETPYLEENHRDGVDYAYQISAQDDYLIHVINYLDGTFDSVFQWVFDPKLLIGLYQEQGFEVEVFTDFNQRGIQEEGEKVMYVMKRGNRI